MPTNKEVINMDNGAIVLLWPVLVGALSVPFIWVAWVILNRIKANEKTTANPPERGEAATRDKMT